MRLALTLRSVRCADALAKLRSKEHVWERARQVRRHLRIYFRPSLIIHGMDATGRGHRKRPSKDEVCRATSTSTFKIVFRFSNMSP